MPSPPAPGQLLPPGRRPRPRCLGSVTSTTRYGVARSSPDRPRRRPGQRLHVPDVVAVDVDAGPRSPAGGTARASGRRATRPASSSADRRRRSAARRRLARSRYAVEQLADVGDPRAAAVSERVDRRRPAPPRAAAPTAAYCARSSSCALADQGISSQSRHDPVGLELLPEARRSVSAARTRSSNAVLESRRRRRTAARCACSTIPCPRSRRRSAARRVLVAADDHHGARAHVLLLAHDPSARRSCGSRRTPRPGARGSPGLRLVSDGDMVGGR